MTCGLAFLGEFGPLGGLLGLKGTLGPSHLLGGTLGPGTGHALAGALADSALHGSCGRPGDVLSPDAAG